MTRSIVWALFICMFSPVLASAAGMDRETLRWVRHKPKITQIEINGNEYFSDSDIRKRMYSRTRDFWRALKGDRRTRVQRESLGRDTLEIKYMYLREGFLGLKLHEEFVRVAGDSLASVRVTIDEGRRFLYGKQKIAGTFNAEFSQPLNKIAGAIKEGDAADPIRMRQVAFDMKSLLANNGYPYAIVIESIDTSAGEMCPINFLIESDSLVHFGAVFVEGSKRYPESVVRREITIKPGNVYKRDDLIDSQRRLVESGYFTTRQIVQSDSSSDRLTPDFSVRVRERKPYYTTVTTGAAQSEVQDLQWDMSAGVGARNFLGSRKIDFNAAYGFGLGSDSRLITHRYRLRYTEPWSFKRRIPLILTTELNPKVQSQTQDYDVWSWSVSLATNWRHRRVYRVNAGIEYQDVNISGIPKDEIELRREEQDAVRRRLFFRFNRDTRDDVFLPRRGSMSEIQSFYFGGFLGGDESFYHVEASWATYRVIWPGWISATRFWGGNVREFGDSKEVPREDRFYLGGANTVRGFPERSLGPVRPDGEPDGANVMAVFNQEFRWKTLQVFQVVPILSGLFRNFPLWQSVFIDIGNGFRQRSDLRSDNLAYTYGTGIQLISPAGPIRLDYARRIKTDNIDEGDRWHFTILYAF